MFCELPPWVDFYFKEEIDYDPEAFKKDFIPENKPRLQKLRNALAGLAEFDADTIGKTLKEVAAGLGLKRHVVAERPALELA